jgi:acyl carrier protein
MEIAQLRLGVLEALKAALPGGIDEATRESFLAGKTNLLLADLNLDSLARMEFCIGIELATGVTLLPAHLAELESTDAVQRYVMERVA